MSIDVIIIGAGPAGVMAAVQLKRANFNIALFEANKVGGLLQAANLVENMAGFPTGIKGPKFCELLHQHLEKLNITPLNEQVEKVTWNKNEFQVQTSRQTLYSKYLIAASGTQPKLLPLPISEKIKNNIHQEIYSLLNCHQKNIAIIGGGDAAFDYALNLAAHNQISIFCRTKISCLPLLLERCQAHKNIKIWQNFELEEVLGLDKGLELKLKSGHENHSFSTDELLFAIGRKPNIEYLKQLGEEQTFKLIADRKVFLVGDVTNGLLRQTTIAAGDGIRAAMEIINLSHREHKEHRVFSSQ